MKAEELRIGNYIIDSDTDRIGHVVRLSKKKVSVKLEHSTLWQDIDEFEPIPLSEEVLLKSGFVKDGNTDYYTCRKVGFTINLSGSLGYRTCIWSNEHVKHLHQLQNLYYALTGEELEVKWS